MIVSAHDGYPRWVTSGADFIEIDIRRDAEGVFVLSHDEPKHGGRYPTFDEVLRVTDGRIGLQLDLKESGYELELLARCRTERIAVTSPDIETVLKVKRHHPHVQAGLTRQFIEETTADFIALDHRHADDEGLDLAARYEIPVWVWTVDDRREMKRLIAGGRVAGIITNRPDVALKLRKARS